MKSKKAQGLLGEHGVELILAVIAIGILIGLGVLVYTFFVGSNDTLRAKATLEDIIEAIEITDLGENKTIFLKNPQGWVLNYYRDIIRPTSCQQTKCLCICEYDQDEEKLFNNCNIPKTGVCTVFEKDIYLDSNIISYTGDERKDIIEIKGFTEVEISNKGGFFNIKRISDAIQK